MMRRNGLIICILMLPVFISAQKAKPPIIGWSSWNNYRIHINEQIVKKQADAMVTSGMKAAGYQYINIDDGYFGGRTAEHVLYCNPDKFPNGMRALADYIHSKGLKAGIYSDAGSNTCGSMWDNDSLGAGVGLYKHDEVDCKLLLNTWDYDFLKVDWCGGVSQKLDEKTRYTEIKNALNKTRKECVYNICRWQFPGTWALSIADSWRISGDISSSFKSICHIIDKNTYLAPYASAGHYNDMDMLQVGRGMSADEDKAHFSMWCMMMSPLLAGNDLSTMSKQTTEILTNTEVIAINQDPAFVQAHKIKDYGDIEIWVKPLKKAMSPEKAVALLNRSGEAKNVTINWADIGITGKATVRDLWNHTDKGTFSENFTATIPAHGVVMLKIIAKEILISSEYEAEYGFLNLLGVANKGTHKENACFSEKYGVSYLGNDPNNWLEFRDVYASKKASFSLRVDYVSGENRNMNIAVNGLEYKLTDLNSGSWDTVGSKTITVILKKGYNTIRIYNSGSWTPDVDKIHLEKIKD